MEHRQLPQEGMKRSSVNTRQSEYKEPKTRVPIVTRAISVEGAVSPEEEEERAACSVPASHGKEFRRLTCITKITVGGRPIREIESPRQA